MILSIYGDQIHCNDGTHIDASVVNDAVLQIHWWCIENLHMSWYYVLESTVSWLLIELNQLQTEYNFPPNTEQNLKYYLEKYFKNNMD